jgi:alkylation response protein AidB-like acyl-CoA dehydrogenase
MRAVPTESGYRVTGRCPLVSGCHEARWFFFIALVEGEDGAPRTVNGAPEVIGVVISAEQGTILDTWYALGMKSSDSNDVEVADVFVPFRRTRPLVPDAARGRHYAGPLYRAPLTAGLAAPWTPVALAVARASIIEVLDIAQRKTPFSSATPLRERASAQAKIGLAETMLQSARCYLYDTIASYWAKTLAGHQFTLQEKTQALGAAINGMQSAARVVELMHTAAGTTGIYERSPLERHLRDTQTLKQHGFQSESRYETLGRVALGLEPDLALVAF